MKCRWGLIKGLIPLITQMNVLNGRSPSNYIRDKRRPLKSNAPSGLLKMGDHGLGFALAPLQTVLAAMRLFFMEGESQSTVDVTIKRTPAEDLQRTAACSLHRQYHHPPVGVQALSSDLMHPGRQTSNNRGFIWNLIPFTLGRYIWEKHTDTLFKVRIITSEICSYMFSL